MSGVNWTEDQFKEHMDRFHPGKPVEACHAKEKPVKRTQPRKGSMNKIEALFAEILEARRIAGVVVEWDYDPGSLLLVPKNGDIPATRYWRDFRAVRSDGVVEAIEVKAKRKNKSGNVHTHFEDGARERLQWAARKFIEYEWYLASYYLGVWSIEEVK